MKLIKNHVSLNYPETLLLISVCNEDKTDNDIGTLGKDLAKEIVGKTFYFIFFSADYFTFDFI